MRLLTLGLKERLQQDPEGVRFITLGLVVAALP